MTHDPLCARTPTGVHYVGVCTCDLIAKVRADQIERDAAVANDQRSKFKARDWDDAIDAVVAALTQATLCDVSSLHFGTAAGRART